MKIQNIIRAPETHDSLSFVTLRRDAIGEISEDKEKILLHEHTLDIFLNESLSMRLTCTPTQLNELVVGRLITEGYIDSIDDIDILYICENGRRARVFLKDGTSAGKIEKARVQTVSTCCADNQTLLEARRACGTMLPLSPLEWEEDWIWNLLDRFSEDSPLHDLTHATHSAYLRHRGKQLYEAEDIGRHNAVDKVIGAAVMRGVDLTDCILFTTGRLPVDMVRKAIMARIPVMVSKEAPTYEGVALARQYGLTLIGNLKNGEMTVYCDM